MSQLSNLVSIAGGGSSKAGEKTASRDDASSGDEKERQRWQPKLSKRSGIIAGGLTAFAAFTLVVFALSSGGSRDAVSDEIDNKIAASRSAIDQNIDSRADELAQAIHSLQSITEGNRSTLDGVAAEIGRTDDRLRRNWSEAEERIGANGAASSENAARMNAIEARFLEALEQIEGRTASLERRFETPMQPRRGGVGSDPVGPGVQSRAAQSINDLPFTPVSIDRWGSALQLGVVRDGRPEFFVRGEVVDGWRVDELAGGGARLVSDAGASLHLSYDSGDFSVGAENVKRFSRLTVVTEPMDARVYVMNVVPRYFPGMPLRPGEYDILVTRDGFHAQRQWITVGANDREFKVALSPND